MPDSQQATDYFGLHLVVNLADQLNGKLQIATRQGVRVAVEFPRGGRRRIQTEG